MAPSVFPVRALVAMRLPWPPDRRLRGLTERPLAHGERFVTKSRLVFTDGERWRLRLLLLLSQGVADATLDCGLRRWPEVGLEEITMDLPEPRFWITSGWPTIHSELWDRLRAHGQRNLIA